LIEQAKGLVGAYINDISIYPLMILILDPKTRANKGDIVIEPKCTMLEGFEARDPEQ
jgi:hypothetical protein